MLKVKAARTERFEQPLLKVFDLSGRMKGWLAVACIGEFILV